MGQDIHGWVEICWDPSEAWVGVIDIGILMERSRHFWEWFLQDWGPFSSVAPHRGVPPNASGHVKRDVEQMASLIAMREVHSFTWITWAEIEAIDWDIEPDRPSVRDVMVVGDDGGSHHESRSHRTRRDTVAPYRSWMLLFDMMRRLAQEYRPEQVRLVVWFDG